MLNQGANMEVYHVYLSSIINALVAALVTVVASIFYAPLIPIIKDKVIYRWKKEGFIDPPEKTTLSGKWFGKVFQHKGFKDSNGQSSLDIIFEIDSVLISGSAILSWSEDGGKTIKNIDLVTSGGFRYNRFLQLDYKANDPGVFSYGTLILELSGDGRRLEGNFSGYGHITEDAICGEIYLEKQLI